MPKYDFSIVGAGLFGSVCAEQLTKKGYDVLVIERKNHVGGFCYTKFDQHGIDHHYYGTHVFHTEKESIWQYINQFTGFNQYRLRVLAQHEGLFYELPRALSQNFKKLTGIYSSKQWGITVSSYDQLPECIRARLQPRDSDEYFSDAFQGVPTEGYEPIFKKLLFLSRVIRAQARYDDHVFTKSRGIVTAPPDQFFGYKFGPLKWRSLLFSKRTFEESISDGLGGIAYITHCDNTVARTRTHYNAALHPERAPKVRSIQYETPYGTKYPEDPAYPFPDTENLERFQKYAEYAKSLGFILGGRLGSYRYMNMDETIDSALSLCSTFS